jgi:hypothetical protein
MRIRFAALSVSLLALAVLPAQAANGIVSMNWDSCTGPIQRASSGPITYSIFVSVLGIDVPHRAYDIRVLYGNLNDEVPDAWRFDVVGCQTPAALTMDPRPPNTDSKTCPAFMQQSTPSLQIKDANFVPPSQPYANTLMRLVLANSYPNGVLAVDPGTRYHLARFVFDHMWSVSGPGTPGLTCGGFEQLMTFKLVYAIYLDLAANEFPFDRATPQLLTVTWDGAVPARPRTWGQIKSQYRN